MGGHHVAIPSHSMMQEEKVVDFIARPIWIRFGIPFLTHQSVRVAAADPPYPLPRCGQRFHQNRLVLGA